MSPDPATGRSTAAISLFGIDEAHVGLQVLDATPSSSNVSGAELRSIVVDLVDGGVHEIRQKLPPIKAYRDGVGYAWEEAPYPRVWLLPVQFHWHE